MMRNLAIIPARSGSKGVPDKNVRDLCGKPLMAWSIGAALESGVFDEVIVSTDSERYATIAREWGASVPFLRSGSNSGDTSTSWDMVDEVLAGYETLGMSFDTFCLLQPTSPLRTAGDIECAYEVLNVPGTDFVVSVCPAEHSPRILGELGDDDSLDGFVSREAIGPRQSYGPYYRINGAIYIARVGEYRKDRFLYRAGCRAYVMGQRESVDIDTESDFAVASALVKVLVGEGSLPEA